MTDETRTDIAIEIRARLEQNGVDVEALQSDFVTYQAIRNYLTGVREARYEGASDSDQIEKELSGMERLIARTETVADEKLSRLKQTGRLSLGTFRIFVSVDILCEDCDTQYGIVELFQRGGCDCSPE